jgi:hypothetical protein
MDNLPNETESLKNSLIICSCLSSISELGMEIKALGSNCLKYFDNNTLTIVSNYVSIFSQHSTGDHLFGSMPIPSMFLLNDSVDSGKINLNNWYMLIYVFKLKNRNIKDDRLIKHDFSVVGNFIDFYPRRFDYFIMQSKKAIKELLWNSSGIEKDINEYSNDLLNVIEQKIKILLLDSEKNKGNDYNYTLNVKNYLFNENYVEKSLADRFSTLIKVSSVLLNLANQKVNTNKYLKITSALILVIESTLIFQVLTSWIKIMHSLELMTWKVTSISINLIEIRIGQFKIFLSDSSSLSEILIEENFLHTMFLGIYFGSKEKNFKIMLLERLIFILRSKNIGDLITLFFNVEFDSEISNLINQKYNLKFIVKNQSNKGTSQKDKIDNHKMNLISFLETILDKITETVQHYQEPFKNVDDFLLKKNNREEIKSKFMGLQKD